MRRQTNDLAGSTHARALTLADIVRDRALRRPDEVALKVLRSDGAAAYDLTIGDIDKTARRAAARLASDLERGGRVLLLAADPADYLAGLFGAFYAGMVPVSGVPPYAPRRGPDRHEARRNRFASIVETSGAAAAVGSRDILDAFEKALDDEGGVELRRIAVDDLGDDDGPQATSPRPDQAPAIALLQYTSGSTGPPGGVVLRHEQLIDNLSAQAQALRLTPADVGVSWLPLFHDLGLIGALLTPLFVGFPVVLMPAAGFLERPQRWLEAISTHKATVSWAPNFAYKRCLAAVSDEVRAKLDLSTWRIAVNAAEPVKAETVRRFEAAFATAGLRPGVAFPCYGLAEATLAVTTPTPGAPLRALRLDRQALGDGLAVDAWSDAGAIELVGCGGPAPRMDIKIVDPETYEVLVDNEIGEIWLSGPSIADGYFGQREKSDATFGGRIAGDARAWLRTGDLGFLRDGHLFISGRLKDLIILRGANVYPQGLEETASTSHAAINDDGACAISVSAGGEDALAVVCELRRGWADHATGVADAVRRAIYEEHGLETFAVTLIKVGALPKTPSGKVQRQACQAAFIARSLTPIFDSRVPLEVRPNSTAAAGSPIDEESPFAWLCRRLTELVPEADIDDKTYLADLGLNSVDVTELAGDIEERFGLRIPSAELYEATRLADFRPLLQRAAVRGD